MNISFRLFGHTITVCRDAETGPKPLSKQGKQIAREFEALSKIGRVKAVRQLSRVEGWCDGETMRLVDARDWVVAAYHDEGRGPAR